MESVPAEQASVGLAPQRHTSRHTRNESTTHVDSTTASSQHRQHRHHHHRSYRNGEEGEDNGRGHKSSHTSRTAVAAAHESAVASHDAVDVNAHNKRTHNITAAPPVAHSHISSSSAHHHTRRAEQKQQRSEEVRQEPEEEPQPHIHLNNTNITHENENGVVVGRGVPSRASLGNSARLPARTTRRTVHSIEGASASWLSNTLRSETMAEQEARRREVIAAYLGITPLREADIAALAPVPEFVEPLADTMRSSVLPKEGSVHGNKKNENMEKKHEAVTELDSRALQEAAETERRLLLDQRDKKTASTRHSEGEKEESTVATQQHRHHHHHHNHTRPDTTVEDEAAHYSHKDAAVKADSVSPNKEVHAEHIHAATASSPHVEDEEDHKDIVVQDVPEEVEASPARGYTYGDSDVSVHEAEEQHANNNVAPPPLQVVSVQEHGKEEEDKAEEATPAPNHTAPTSRPASASLHATPRRITPAEDMASRASLSSRGRPSAPKWVERLSTPTSRSHSASVIVMGNSTVIGGDVHSTVSDGDKNIAANGIAQGSSVRRSATPQSAQRGRPPVRSQTPSVSNGANGRRASSASCSARLLQLAQPRRRYDPVAEERAVAEELALLQKEMKSTAATPRASVTNNNGRLVTGNVSASARPSVGATSLGSVRGRPIRVSAAGPVGAVTSRTASRPNTPITTDVDVKGGDAQTKNGDTNGDNEPMRGMNVKEERGVVDNQRVSVVAPSRSSRVSSVQQLEFRQPTPRTNNSNTPPLSSIPMDERVRLMQLPHAAYIAPTALRLDLNSPEDMKELYRQQYLVDPQLHPRPARRQFHSTSQADLFGMYSRHPEWYNTQKNGNDAGEGKSNNAEENNGAADATSLSEADAGRIRVGGRKQVPHREGLQVLPSASQKASDGMSILARFAVGGSATTDMEKDNSSSGEAAQGFASDVVGTKQQQEGRYASNVSHFNLFSWNGFDATGQNDENSPCNGDQQRKSRGIAGRASVPTALAARDHLLNNLLPKENTSQDLKECNYNSNSSARGEYSRPHVRGRAAIQAQYAAQPDNAPPGPRRPSARVTDVMKTLSAMGDHDIFGVEERNAQLVQRAALLAKSTPEGKQPQQISCGTSTMSVTTQTQERRNSNGVVVPYGVDYEEEEGEGLPAEAPMFQPRVANGTSMIH